MINFSSLNLNKNILSALEEKGYSTPTPIQEQAIPHILEKHDIMGIAQTGTGKTAAFSLPILHNLAQSNQKVKSNHVRCLILTPTRELASQIADNIEFYGKNLNMTHAVIFGGVSEKPQIQKLSKGLDILIATPGRLLDLMGQGYINYSQLEVLVLDEADRMLDMGFINDVKKIIAKLPKERQALFFSATMSETISRLANSILKDPVRVEVTPQSTTVEKISQSLLLVHRSHKSELLKTILKHNNIDHVLVFTQMKHAANKVVEDLCKNGINAAVIHGNKSQGAREKALADFRSGAVRVLIATDIAARGIDIPTISHVINYDLPQDPESYVHRIGRTARAGREGVAISFCDDSERMLLSAIERTIRMKIPVDTSHPFHGSEAAHGAPRRLSQGVRKKPNKTQEESRAKRSGEGSGGRIISSGNKRNFEKREEKRSENRDSKPKRPQHSNKKRPDNNQNNNKKRSNPNSSNKKKSGFGKKLKGLFGFGNGKKK